MSACIKQVDRLAPTESMLDHRVGFALTWLPLVAASRLGNSSFEQWSRELFRCSPEGKPVFEGANEEIEPVSLFLSRYRPLIFGPSKFNGKSCWPLASYAPVARYLFAAPLRPGIAYKTPDVSVPYRGFFAEWNKDRSHVGSVSLVYANQRDVSFIFGRHCSSVVIDACQIHLK